MSFFKKILFGAFILANLLAVGPVTPADAEAIEKPANVGNPVGLTGPEQRIALVIGNSNYRNVAQLPNPANDAKAVAQLLTSAGFEVISATDLSHNQMIQVMQDFSGKVAGSGPNTVAMVYYAGHGVQLAGENYLVPVDARISSEPDLVNGSVRLVDVMATLEAIPSRMRIVILDACRNNPFPSINDAGRGLAIVDAPNGSIVGYSTAPGMEALDGEGNHSPYTSAFLDIARQPNLPIEQLFKRVRLAVNNATNGRQTPWESSSLTNDFYFFGDTAVAATRAPDRSPVVQMASNLPSRSVRQAYDYVLSEGSPEYYEEFIRMYPQDPLCDRIRGLLGNWRLATAWHHAVLANSPGAYRSFHDAFPHSPYARTALRLQAQPRAVPLMQFTRLSRPATHLGNHMHALASSKAATLPAKGINANHGNMPARINANASVHPMHGKSRFHDGVAPRRMSGGMGSGMHAQPSPRFAATHSRGSFGGSHSFGGGRSFGGGGSFGGRGGFRL
jgi:hypothetical protein